MNLKDQIKLAKENIKMAYTPYSKFKVTSVLVGKSGKLYTGVNIENASLTPGICAERTAFSKAVSEGELEFQRIIIMGGKEGNIKDYVAPCGVCRQVMMEFCDPKTFEVVLAVDEDNYKTFTLEDLLPLGFGPNDLG